LELFEQSLTQVLALDEEVEQVFGIGPRDFELQSGQVVPKQIAKDAGVAVVQSQIHGTSALIPDKDCRLNWYD
jgi:hypothetical protein